MGHNVSNRMRHSGPVAFDCYAAGQALILDPGISFDPLQTTLSDEIFVVPLYFF